MLHTSTVISYLKACFVENPVKNHRWKQQCYIELMRFLKIGHWFTGGGGGGGLGGQGIQTSPLPYLKFPPPQTFSLASSLESRFSLCSLRNLEYCCVICRYFPCFPLFLELPPPALSSPSSRTPSTPFSPGHPPPVLFDCLIIIAVYHFSFLSRLFSPRLVVDCFLFIIISIWD